MQDCEELLLTLCPDRQIVRQERIIDLTPPWPRLTLAEAFARYATLPLDHALAEDRFDEQIALVIEPQLPADRPLFLTEYPVEHAALARKKPDNPKVAERFELYIGGFELANAFSELTDPLEQRQRFTREENQRRAAGKTPYPEPERFLTELETLPSAAGIAFGVDRIIMLLCNIDKIENTVFFPPESL